MTFVDVIHTGIVVLSDQRLHGIGRFIVEVSFFLWGMNVGQYRDHLICPTYSHHSDDGRSKHVRNIGLLQRDCMVLYPRTLSSALQSLGSLFPGC
jgi:hypothetical protein